MEQTADEGVGTTAVQGEPPAADLDLWAALGPAALLDRLQDWLIDFGPRLEGALLVLLLGWLLAWALRWLLFLLLERRSGLSLEVRFFVPQFVYLSGVLLTLVLTLAILGVADSLLGVLVPVTIATGLFADLSYGAQLLTLRPFRVGDVIELKEAQVVGVVTRISMIGARIESAAGTEVFVPSRRLYGEPVVNHTARFVRGVRLRFVVAPEADIGSVLRVVEEVLAGEKRIDEFDRAIGLTEVTREGVTVSVRFRTRFDAADEVVGALLTAARARFVEAGIGIVSLTREE